jgi:hypothetical protein
VRVSATFALRDGAAAHRALEGRQVIGKIVLRPSIIGDSLPPGTPSP